MRIVMFDNMDDEDNESQVFNDYDDQNRNLDQEALRDDDDRGQTDDLQENYFAHKKFKHRHRSESCDKPMRQPFQIELDNDGVYVSPGGHKHKHRHKKFRRYDVGDEVSPSSENARRSLDVETSPDSSGTSRQVSREDDGYHDVRGLEDGELEDGELDDDDGEIPKERSHERKHKNHATRSSHHFEKSPTKDVQEPEGEVETEEVEAFKEEIVPPENNKRERRKARRGHRPAKKKNKEVKKKKVKHHQYVDYDKVDEKEESERTEPKKSRSPPATYDSPYESPYTSPHRQFSSPHHRHSPRRDRSPSGGYGSPYHSPPGLYDSPSDESGEETTSNKNMKNNEVPAQVQPDRPPQTFGKKRGRDRNSGMKRKNKDTDTRREPSRKRPLLADMPMHERPHCKYFKEGKCSKGHECPFNHDFKPPGKLEVCKFYINDTCVKGSRCTYMHSDYPCKYFHTGQTCYQGDNCKFSHEPLNEETALIVQKMKENRDYPIDNQPRPSLLGSPPRMPAKKIPSIFEIEVFPPNQHPSPRKPPVSPARPSGFYNDLGSQNGPHDNQGPHFQGQGQNDGPPRFLGNGGEGPPRFSGHSGSDSEGQHMQGPGNEGHRFQNPGDGSRYNGPCPGSGSDGPRYNGPALNVSQRQNGPGDGQVRFNGPGTDGPSRFNGPDIPPRYNGPGPDGLHFQNTGDGPARFGPRGPGTNMGPGFGPGPRFGPGPKFNQGPGPNFGQGPNFGLQRGQGPMGFNNPAAPVLNMLGAILSQAPPELIQSALAPRLMTQQGNEPPHNDNADGRGQQPTQDFSADHRGPVSQTPPHSMEFKEIKQEPLAIKQEPLNSKLEYREKVVPRDIKQEPLDIKMEPQEIKQEPREIKQEPHDPTESPLHTAQNRDHGAKKTSPNKNSEDSVIDSSVASQEKKVAHESNVSNTDDPSALDNEEDDAAAVALMHLPPMQRELFLRIHQQQQHELAKENKGETVETADDATDKEKDDDDWYSSDEEGGAPKLTDVLKNLNKQPVQTTPESPQPGKTATGSTFNIMQMIQSIKNQASSADSTSTMSGSQPSARDSRDPRQRVSRTDPRKTQKERTEVPNFPGMSSGQFPEFRLPPLHVDPPVTHAVMLSMLYRIHTVEVNPQKPYYSIPSNVDPWHAQFKSDPRIQKYIARTGCKKPVSKNQTNGDTDPVPVQKSLDPRKARHVSIDDKDKLSASSLQQKSKDPRLRKTDSGDDNRVPVITTDFPPSLLQRTVSEQFMSNNPPDFKIGDPRLQRVQTVPPQNVPAGSLDPRRARQQNQIQGPPIQQPNPMMFNRQCGLDGSVRNVLPVAGGLRPMNFPRFPNNPRMLEPTITNNIGVQGDPWSPDVAGPMEQRPNESRLINVSRFDSMKMLPMGGMSSGQTPSADPRSARKPPGGVNQTADPQLSRNTDTISDSSNTGDSAHGSKDSHVIEQKGKFDHRNNPKFKRKPASADSTEKRFTGQRKSSMEYSSPLGLNEASTDSSSGYNSYNRPSANPPRRPKPSDSENCGGTVPSTDQLGPGVEQNASIEQGDGAFSLPNMMAPPLVVSPPVLQEPPLKDLFKSIDPTASPFC